MDFADDTYIVLDLPPSELTKGILEIRRAVDPWRAKLPVEITLAGSGGVGVIQKDESQDAVSRLMSKVAVATRRISLTFDRIDTFPNTKLYHMRAKNEDALTGLHERIKESGIKFGTSNFPFVPHCTIANLANGADPQIVEQIEGMHIPEHEIALTSMSVYSLSGSTCILRGRWTLED